MIDVLTLKRDHLRRRVSASRRVHNFARCYQPSISLEPLGFCSYLTEFNVPHRILERSRLKSAAIDNSLALGVFVDTLADGSFRFFLALMLERPTLRAIVRSDARRRFHTAGHVSAIPP